MKKTIISLSLVTLVFISCKETPKTNEISKPEIEVSQEEIQIDKNSKVLDNSWMAEIQLNNGKKWDANIETNEGILRMQNTLKTQATTTLEEFYMLAEKLNEDKNFVVKNCTMKGASHDNLHVWLMPLIEKIEAISETKNLEDALIIKKSIEENINAYAIYFQ